MDGERQTYTVGVADITKSARADANDQGQEENARRINRTKGIKGFFNRVFRGSAFKEAFDVHYSDQAMVQMRENGGIGRNEDEIRRNNAAVLERTIADGDEFIRENEDRLFLNENDPRAAQMRDLLGGFAQGRIGQEAYEAERDRLQAEILGNGYGRDELFGINNIDEIAGAMRLRVEQGEDVNEVLAGFRVARMADAHVGANTEARLGRVDRIVEKVMKSKVGRFLPSTAVGFGVNVALNAVVPAAKWGLVAGGIVVGGVPGLVVGAAVAGGMAAAKERIRWTDDRDRFIRDNTSGRHRPSLDEQRVMFDEWRAAGVDRNGRAFGEKEYKASVRNAEKADKAHQRLMETQYGMRNIFDLQDGLNNQLEILGNDPTTAQVQEAIAMLGAVNQRVFMGDNGDRDLIDFTGAESIDEEWNNLSLTRSQLRARLEIVTTPDGTNQALLDELFQNGANLNSLIVAASEAERETIQADIDLKDANAVRQRRAKSICAGFKAAGMSAGLGAVVQEAIGFIDPNSTNLVEEVYARATGNLEDVHGTVRTALAGGYDAITGAQDIEIVTDFEPASTTMTTVEFGDGQSIQLSDDLHIDGTPGEGAFSIIDKNGDVLADNLFADPATGALDAASTAKIESLGGVFSSNSWTTPETLDAAGSARNLIDQFRDHITDWSSRDVDYNPGDGGITQNELSGHLGDNGELWDSATPWGSWSDSGAADVTAAPENSVVMMFPAAEIYPDGVPADVTVAPDGNIYLEFGYQEGFPPEVMSGIDHHPTVPGAKISHWPGSIAWVDHSGGHIEQFASIPGDSDVSGEILHHHTETTLVGPGYEIEQEIETPITAEMPTIIPFESRRPLGDYAQRNTPSNYGYYNVNSGYNMSRGEREAIRQRVSPRLQANPNETLSLPTETDWYVRTLEPDYRQSLEDDMSSSPELNGISDEIKTVVAIPVYAPNDGDKIYKTLSLYANQEDIDPNSNMVCLYLSWRESDASRPGVAEAIQQAREEVERARRDYPELKVALFEHENNQRESDPARLTFELARRLNDTICVAIDKSIKNGTRSSDDDIVIVRNDIDLVGIGRNYVSNIQKSADDNPNIDSFTGMTRFDIPSYIKTPGFGIVMNFERAFNTIGKRYGYIHTDGANFAYRVSTFAGMGGLDDSDGWTGPGADDLKVGHTIAGARSGVPVGAGGGYSSPGVRSDDTSNVTKFIGSRMLIDTNGDRYLGEYANGRFIDDAYSPRRYGAGGNRSQDTSGNTEEDVRTRRGFAALQQRVELNMSGMLSRDTYEWRNGEKRQLGEIALPFFFPTDTYKLTRDGSGRASFKFTRRGRLWLKKQLLKGDGYGARKLRAFYGKRVIGGTEFQSRLIGADV
jgi:hypothetical protein